MRAVKTSALAFLLLATGTSWADTAATPPPAPKQPAIAPATAALIPDAGWLVSYLADDDKLVVTRITKTGPKELLRTPHDYAQRTWIDSKTLLVVDVDSDKNVKVQWIVDGVVDAKRTINHKAAVWALKNADDNVSVIGTYRTADGGIWLQRCIKQETLECDKSTWLRIDGKDTKLSKSKPKKLTVFGDVVTASKVEPPAGYSGKLIKIKSTVSPKRKVAAIECTGPKGKLVWSQESPPIDPAESFTPKKVRWILTTPPLFEVEGLFVNPVAQEETKQYVFRECGADPYDGVSWIADHAWSYVTRDDDNTHVLVDDKPVAVFVGGALIAAPK